MRRRGRKSAGKRDKKRGMWEDAIRYLRGSWRHIYIVIVIFFAAGIISFFFPENFTFLNEILEQLVEDIKGKNTGEMIWYIFQNNVLVSFFAVVLGIGIGIFPVINAIINGTVLGYVLALSVALDGASSVLYLLPHGIFELPAIFIALGLGLRLGMFIFAKDKGKEFKMRFYGSMKVFFMIIVPLLIIAAIIEGILIVSAG
jgi:stage II sporulation protein M